MPSIQLVMDANERVIGLGSDTVEAARQAALAEAAANDAEATLSLVETARDVTVASSAQYASEAAAVAALADGAFGSYLDANGLPVWGQRTGASMTPISGPWFSSDKVDGVPVLATDRGLTGDGVTDDQAAMSALIADPTAKVIRFPAGVYRATLANGISNRTFIFDEGAIIDGVVHLATGGGPDVDGGGASDPIEWVDNVNVIGTITSTVRVGTYYCRGVHIPKIRITGISSSYLNQTAEGGSKGVHIYVGSKKVYIGDIDVESATAGNYAIGIDIANLARQTGDYQPENIEIGRAVVKGCSQAVLVTAYTKSLKIGTIDADSWDAFDGMPLNGDEDLRIDKVRLIGAPVTAGKGGIYLTNTVSASFGEVEIEGASGIGFRTASTCARVDAGIIRARGCNNDQVRIESPGTIGEIIVRDGLPTAGKYGILIQGNADGLRVGLADDDAGGGVLVVCDDVTIASVVAKNNTAANKYGLFLSTSARFVNQYLLVDNNTQGLRMTTITDPAFGDMFILNNTNGIVGSSVTGIGYRTVTYSGNGTDTNITLNTIPGFKGSLARSSVGSLTDANATLTVGTSAVTQVCNVALTADRTVTLSATGAKNGDRFRITRTAASTGAFNLNVAGVTGLGTVALATSRWLEVEYNGAWFMTARGSLA